MKGECKMTKEEALEKIIDGLDNLEEFDEALDVLRGDSDNVWESRYIELKEKYKKRFKESLNKTGLIEKEDTNVDEDTIVTWTDIDFTGENE